MSRAPTLLTAVLLGSLLLSACASDSKARTGAQARPSGTSGDAARAPAELPPPVGLPPQAREVLRGRMERHGAEMTVLMATVVLLDYEAAEELALEIAREPRLGRPAAGETDTLNAMLPPRFFELQDQLVHRAEATATAARMRDEVGLARAFGALGETCVSCHAAYLRTGADEGAAAPPVE